MSSIQEMIAAARNDPALYANIEELLDRLETPKTDYLENKTMRDINAEVVASLRDIGITGIHAGYYCEKLIGYRHVAEIYQLHKGKHVRWIKKDKPDTLAIGGIVVDIKFTNEGTVIMCRMMGNGPRPRFLQYRFDNCLTYQKLSDDEQLILSIYDIV